MSMVEEELRFLEMKLKLVPLHTMELRMPVPGNRFKTSDAALHKRSLNNCSFSRDADHSRHTGSFSKMSVKMLVTTSINHPRAAFPSTRPTPI